MYVEGLMFMMNACVVPVRLCSVFKSRDGPNSGVC
jgi:hypothetical protein